MAFGRPVRPLCRSLVLLTALVVRPATGRAQAPAQSAPPAPAPAFKVEVIETTPLPGLDLKLEQIPAPVQTAVSADIDASGALDLSDFLNRRFNGVFVNEMQGNPFQTGSQLSRLHGVAAAGHAAGAVGLHGRRSAEPAVRRRRELGSDSAHGDRIDDADARIESAVRAQHARRRAVDSDQGRSHQPGHNGPRDLRQRRAPRRRVRAWRQPRAAGSTGMWRATCSPRTAGATTRRRTSASCSASSGWHEANDDTSLSVGYADNSLTGNGLQEQRFLDRDYASVYTKPDETDNRATFLNLTTRHDSEPRR